MKASEWVQYVTCDDVSFHFSQLLIYVFEKNTAKK